jgi:hypothetical protein
MVLRGCVLSPDGWRSAGALGAKAPRPIGGWTRLPDTLRPP